MFILLDEDNKILASSDFKFTENATETKLNIIRGYDGRLYSDINCPKQTLDELKEKKLSKLKYNCNISILKIYPIEKQICILGRIADYSDDNFDEMNLFITSKLEIYKQKQDEIKLAPDEETLNNIDIYTDFDLKGNKND